MANRIAIKRGIVVSVYDDRLLPIYEAIGAVTITRASEVEFDHDSRMWVAVEKSTGKIIATGRERAAVIADEIRYLEGGL